MSESIIKRLSNGAEEYFKKFYNPFKFCPKAIFLAGACYGYKQARKEISATPQEE